MATSRDHLSLRNIVVVVLILSLTIPPSKSGEKSSSLKVKMALGSSPPKCVNKCLGCKPCMAALVISQPKPQPQPQKEVVNNQSSTIFVRDESYYLLSWKCRCRNKYFQP